MHSVHSVVVIRAFSAFSGGNPCIDFVWWLDANRRRPRLDIKVHKRLEVEASLQLFQGSNYQYTELISSARVSVWRLDTMICHLMALVQLACVSHFSSPLSALTESFQVSY